MDRKLDRRGGGDSLAIRVVYRASKETAAGRGNSISLSLSVSFSPLSILLSCSIPGGTFILASVRRRKECCACVAIEGIHIVALNDCLLIGRTEGVHESFIMNGLSLATTIGSRASAFCNSRRAASARQSICPPATRSETVRKVQIERVAELRSLSRLGQKCQWIGKLFRALPETFFSFSSALARPP